MSAQCDGGPAFPAGKFIQDVYRGMSLRDYFAGQALAGMGDWIPDGPETFGDYGERRSPGTPYGDDISVKSKARWSYLQADAMLAAREVRS